MVVSIDRRPKSFALLSRLRSVRFAKPKHIKNMANIFKYKFLHPNLLFRVLLISGKSITPPIRVIKLNRLSTAKKVIKLSSIEKIAMNNEIA